MKWILIAVAAALVLVLVTCQRTSMKSTYVNGLVPYNELPNREYVLERDCYLFKFTNDNSAWPLLGDHATVAKLPEIVTEKNIGTAFDGVRILDVVKIGTTFKLVSVRRDQSAKSATITFEVLLLTTEDRKYPRLDAYWILDHRPEAKGLAPTFLPAYAVDHQRL